MDGVEKIQHEVELGQTRSDNGLNEGLSGDPGSMLTEVRIGLQYDGRITLR